MFYFNEQNANNVRVVHSPNSQQITQQLLYHEFFLPKLFFKLLRAKLFFFTKITELFF